MVAQFVMITAQGIDVGERATHNQLKRQQTVSPRCSINARGQCTGFIESPLKQQRSSESLPGKHSLGPIGGQRVRPHPTGNGLSEIKSPD